MAKVDKLVSIVIAVYNTERYLGKCLDSLLDQTYSNIEIICVDDGSTDSSYELLERYRKKDARIITKRIEHSGKGAGRARNTGLQCAKGEYVFILDSDDFFDRFLVEKCVNRAEQTKADIVNYDDHIYFESKGVIDAAGYALSPDLLHEKDVFDWSDLGDNLFHFAICCAWSKMYRLDFIRENRIEFLEIRHHDDYTFVFKALCSAKRVTCLNEKLLYYRRGTGESQTDTKNQFPLVPVEGLGKTWEVLEKFPFFDKIIRPWYRFYIEVSRDFLLTLTDISAAEKLYDALLSDGHFKIIMNGERECFVNINDYFWVQELKLLSKGDFFERHTYYSIPKNELNGVRDIIVYGAGQLGKKIVNDQLNFWNGGSWRVVGWVDRQADTLGFPIQPVSSILTTPFDKIVISIISERTRRAVKEDLIKMGVPAEKIIYELDKTMI